MEGRPPPAPRRSLSPSTTRQQVCRPGGCRDDYDCMSYRQPLSGKCQGSVRLQSCSLRKNTPREPLLTILALALFGHSLVRTAKPATCFCNTVRRATATYSTRQKTRLARGYECITYHVTCYTTRPASLSNPLQGAHCPASGLFPRPAFRSVFSHSVHIKHDISHQPLL